VELLVEGLKKQQEPVLNYNHRLTKITPIQDKVELEFNDGEHQDVVDLVIGADGIHSTVAKQLNVDDEIPPLYSGANIVYGKIPQPSTIEYFQNHPIFTPHSVVNGPGTGEFIAFTAGSGETQQFIWATTYASSKPPQRQDQDEWNEAPQSAKELLQQDVFSNYPSSHPLHDFYEMTKDEDLLHFGLYYRHHKKSWSNDRVVLLGDACHATLPYVGQGANQAIEDSIYLADCLDKQNDYNAAYEDYYKRRFPRTKRVVQMAGIMHKLYHSESWILQGILEYLLKSVVEGGAILKQVENEIIKECPVQDDQRYAPKP
jgi:salicylate hydroxylase